MPDTEAMKALLAIEEAILATMPGSPWDNSNVELRVQTDRVRRLRTLIEVGSALAEAIERGDTTIDLMRMKRGLRK